MRQAMQQIRGDTNAALHPSVVAWDIFLLRRATSREEIHSDSGVQTLGSKKTKLCEL
jgi:hypothetical protein